MTDLASAFRRAALVFACASGLATPAVAAQSPLVGYEDIDLFVANPAASDIPNVLFILDTSANWSSGTGARTCTTYADGTPGPSSTQEVDKKVGLEKCALVNTLLSLPTNPDGTAKFRIGFLYMNAPNSQGAYPRKKFTELTSQTRAALVDVIKNTSATSSADQGSNNDIARSLWEAYRWFSGRSPLYGRAQTDLNKVRWDPEAFGEDGRYRPPSPGSCAKNYIIYIANGGPQGTEDEIRTRVVDAGGNGTPISYSTSYITTADQNNWGDETSRFIKGIDVSSAEGAQTITTYTIMVSAANPNTSEQRTNNYVREVGLQGGGGSFTASNVAEIANAINTALNQIQASNSVFASASLPVSVNSQGTFLNQVFMGMFRPDENAKPRWVGNLKQYKFSYNAGTGKVTLVDANDAAVVNPTTGFVSPNAVSFWTSGTPNTDFWKNKTFPGGEVNAGGASDSPDGQLVEKGGAAQRLRDLFIASQSTRKVYTCVGCTGLTDLTAAAQSFSVGNNALTQARLGVGSGSDRDDLIEWVRGADNKSPSNEQGPGTVTRSDGTTVTATVRPTIHGDVVHSAPAVINYGGTTGVVVFYGGNDGMLRAVYGQRSGGTAGTELWSFIPEEFIGKLKRLRDNTTTIKYATSDTTLTPTPERKDYAMDGPVTFYQKGTAGTTTQAIIYAGMRRGGRALYAFDVTTPTAPKLLWKKTAAGDLASLGQTWSEARVTRIAGYTNPVLVMGGGYDPVEDNANPTPTTMGNVVVVLDAITGTVLRVFDGISRPVPASLALVDRDGDGKMDRAYAVDLGGSIYRLTFPDATPANWTLTKIADFSGSTTAGQKMFYAPAVNITDTLVTIQVGTGDREKPLQASGTLNRFFTVIDAGQTSPVELRNLTQMTETGLATIPSGSYGCYYNLTHAGEKVVNGVVYVGGYAYFGTNGPSVNTCSNTLGTARAYAVPAVCGPIRVTTLVGGGFPPTPVVGKVLIPNGTQDGADPVDCETHPENCRTVPICVGACTPVDCDGNPANIISGFDSTNLYACPPQQRLRRGWSITNPR